MLSFLLRAARSSSPKNVPRAEFTFDGKRKWSPTKVERAEKKGSLSAHSVPVASQFYIPKWAPFHPSVPPETFYSKNAAKTWRGLKPTSNFVTLERGDLFSNEKQLTGSSEHPFIKSDSHVAYAQLFTSNYQRWPSEHQNKKLESQNTNILFLLLIRGPSIALHADFVFEAKRKS